MAAAATVVLFGVIDTHCHLTFPELSGQLDDVLTRAAEAGVTHLVTIGTTRTDSAAGLNLARQYEQVACTAGIHPCYPEEVPSDFVPVLRDLAADPNVVAIGECGLDYFHDRVDRKTQRIVFTKQLMLAVEVGKPVVIHSRESVADCLEVLNEFGQLAAVFHCFTGSIAEAEQIAERGYYVGFTGPITFKKNEDLREAARRVPLERLMVETDAPFLSPEPLRGRRPCEPGYVAHTLTKLAEVRGLSVEEMDRITTENANRLFGWPA